MSDEHRRDPRYEVPGALVVHNANVMRVLNISAHGALVEGTTGDGEVGEAVKVLLYLPLLDRRMPLNLEANLVRRNNGRFAVEYDSPPEIWPRLISLLGRRDR